MLVRRTPRAVRLQWQLARRISRLSPAAYGTIATGPTSRTLPSEPRRTCAPFQLVRSFHSSPRLEAVKPVLLADIGEGIVECEIIQWFVEPGARVEEFSKLCEVQSDKASVEITSRFEGVVKKLYYDAGEMAKVGKPFVDIDIQGDVSQEALDELTSSGTADNTAAGEASSASGPQQTFSEPSQGQPKGKHAALATPAVRHLCKELKLDLLEIDGTGRDGRVLKEDIYRFIESRDGGGSPAAGTPSPLSSSSPPSSPGAQVESRQALTKTQEGMFKAMTRSLNIPHFLYADEIDFTELTALRSRLNKVLATKPSSSAIHVVPNAEGVSKLSYLPFIIKAVSIALQQYPILNARVDTTAGGGPDASTPKPSLVYRAQHNIGVAMDTPSGLLVPVVRDVASHSILTLAAELARLQGLAVAGRLGPQDMAGGTISVSNIGSIGGTYCSPVIVEGQLAILGVGRMRDVPDVEEDAGAVGGGWRVKGVRKVCNFSWSADHRVVDGATMARAAGVVRALVEEPDAMVMHLR
ncbi:hypothetical protein M406DRAFT_98980 [Cryphonectria parasitica EP155]|uniref:Dihydrolipoamide acetyltransferase component of pyruvate dehydrogenase complex n=1 Tax=Cryphonectria parasitica (strain ATCC 38755 / EP155) TaxID=660469 RepID=A0A9P5CLY1_CRYP1|nr:uncharacterized protein M406DRAFT_98980 [Cryphonectria parasitica EP155]KAF3762290.1 hypothetical protein M406DRAFT_98980 [Cryphonectria parasitica EP155]